MLHSVSIFCYAKRLAGAAVLLAIDKCLSWLINRRLHLYPIGIDDLGSICCCRLVLLHGLLRTRHLLNVLEDIVVIGDDERATVLLGLLLGLGLWFVVLAGRDDYGHIEDGWLGLVLLLLHGKRLIAHCNGLRQAIAFLLVGDLLGLNGKDRCFGLRVKP